MREIGVDVLVVGGGPAGLAAAASAAECGRRVAMVDDNPAPGGQIWRSGVSGRKERAARLWTGRVESLGVEIISAATIVDADGPGRLFADTASGIVSLACENLILATGATELFLPFPGWTLPNVMGAGGIQALVKSGWDVEGKRIAIAGSGPLLLAVASYLRTRGSRVVCIAEQASHRDVIRFGLSLVAHPRKLVQGIGIEASLRGVERLWESWPVRAEGRDRVERVVIRALGGDREFECDLLACGFGLVPNVRIASFLGCLIDDGAVKVDEYQRTSVERIYCAGESTGIGGVDVAIVEGRIAGCAAAHAPERARKLFGRRRREHGFARRLNRAFTLREELRSIATDESILCRCEDVALGAVRRYADVRQAKLLTRVGMGPCQGRVCGPAMGYLLGWTPDRVRPPFFPTTFETMGAMSDGKEVISSK